MKNERKTLSYETYFDKVYGCFLGKCIGGTAGGPAEGRKELLDFPLNEELLHRALPNDDLDLQILWLELIERAGFDITARDMGREFYDKVPYGPGEYAYFQKNFERGIYPPLSGTYNNRYYQNGMGCPIRSEIWACLFPGRKELLRPFVEMDGCLDHARDPIDAEQFLAALECDLFFTDELRPAVERAAAGIPEGRFRRLVYDVLRLRDEGADWKFARGTILRHYGHADCTNLYENMGFTLIALLWGEGDFRETIRVGLACGYDTDCICATAASALGLIRGAKRLLCGDGMSDTGLVIGVGTRRQNCSVEEFSRSVCAAGLAASARFDGATAITDAPAEAIAAAARVPDEKRTPAVTVEAVYAGAPVLSPDAPTSLKVALVSHLPTDTEARVRVTPPAGVTFAPETAVVKLPAGGRREIDCRAALAPDATALCQKNIFTVTLDGDFGELKDDFGLVGCDIWYRYGPFLQNIKDISFLPPHEKYSPHLPIAEGEVAYDVKREYHLGGVADIDRAFVPEAEPFTAIAGDGRAETIPERVVLREDLFDLAEIQPYEGPHIDYLWRKLLSPEAREVEIAVGHTAPFKLWVNGKYVGGSDKTKWWTLENMHFTVPFVKGENTIILKCAQQSDHAKFSLIYRVAGGHWRQYADFVSVLAKP